VGEVPQKIHPNPPLGKEGEKDFLFCKSPFNSPFHKGGLKRREWKGGKRGQRGIS